MDAISFGDDDEDWMEETAPREEEEQSVPPYDKEDGEAEDGEAAPEPDSQPAKAVSKTQDPKPQLGSIPVPSLKNEEQKPKPSSVAAAPVQHKTMAPVQRTPPSAAPPVPEDDGESSAEEGELVGESAGDYIEMVTKGSAHLSPHQFPRYGATSKLPGCMYGCDPVCGKEFFHDVNFYLYRAFSSSFCWEGAIF